MLNVVFLSSLADSLSSCHGDGSAVITGADLSWWTAGGRSREAFRSKRKFSSKAGINSFSDYE